MNCPICNSDCVLIPQGQDEYGVIREWCCTNCAWAESDEEESDEEESDEEESDEEEVENSEP